jgi:cytoskeletal protein CcmA (bactofilin family)
MQASWKPRSRPKTRSFFGKVVGNLYIEDRVELHVSAVVIGDLHAKELVINEGAVFHGNCSMQKAGKNIAPEK